MKAWEAGRADAISIPVGYWELQNDGTIKAIAPESGFHVPRQIPPGQYYIVVAWAGSRASSQDAVNILAPSGSLPSGDDARRALGAIVENVGRVPSLQSELTVQGKLVIRDCLIDGSSGKRWVRPKRRMLPRKRALASRTNSSGDKIDAFPDLQTAMPKLVSDIKRVRNNIWIAWWALDDDFPTGFEDGIATRFFSDEIRSALAKNASLEVFILIWEWDSWAFTKPNPAKFCNPADLGRLHVEWQNNGILGSHHEKFFLMDLSPDGQEDERAVLWCLGWNGEITYWDSYVHTDPDPYRDAAGGPHELWHDSGVRVVSSGTSIAFESEFRRRSTATPPPVPNPPPPLPEAVPTFSPRAVGLTNVVPLIHVERTTQGSIEQWYVDRINNVAEGFYIENQYFSDFPPAASDALGLGRPALSLANLIIDRFLAESGQVALCVPQLLYVTLTLCHHWL